MKDALGSEEGKTHPWVEEGSQRVRIGIQFMNPYIQWNQLLEQVLYAEELGVDSVWIPDHPVNLADCWNTLAALAVTTKKIRLGTLANCIYYRNPAVLARQALDVERWSNGRLVLGLGVGDMPFEFQQLGYVFPSTRERQELLEETIQVLRGIWHAQEPFSYQGKHIQVQQIKLPIPPLQQPSIPILIAGGGEKLTLRNVARYADVCNFGAHSFTGGAASISDVQRKYRVLDEHCQTTQRDPSTIMRSYVALPFMLGNTPEILEKKRQALPPPVQKIFQSSIVALNPRDAIRYCQDLIAAGVQYFIFGVGLQDRGTVDLLMKEVYPALLESQQ